MTKEEVLIYSFFDKEGKPTSDFVEIIRNEVEVLAFAYVEINNGKAPPKELIEKWTCQLFESVGIKDD